MERQVGQHHFDASRVLTRIVAFVAETLVPLMVVAPKNHVLLPSETATALLPGGGVVEPLDGSLLQPTITMVAEMTAMMIAFFLKRDAAQRGSERWRRTRNGRIGQQTPLAAIRSTEKLCADTLMNGVHCRALCAPLATRKPPPTPSRER